MKKFIITNDGKSIINTEFVTDVIRYDHSIYVKKMNNETTPLIERIPPSHVHIVFTKLVDFLNDDATHKFDVRDIELPAPTQEEIDELNKIFKHNNKSYKFLK